jgi:GntR family transcriptional regulator, transcriptional repressor for pyruvate dehydrogenase complex
MDEHMTIKSRLVFDRVDNKERLNERIVAQVKKFIHSNHLKFGDKLPSERELTEQIGVSREVVREALRSLEQSGLVEIKQGATGGAFVVSNLHKPIFNAASELYNHGKLTLAHFVETRNALESVTVRTAAEIATPEDISRLKKINDIYLADIDDEAKHREYAEEFHVAIAEISGNHLSKLLIRALFQLLDLLRSASVQTKKFKRDTHMYHAKIIDAMAKKNGPLCEYWMAKDIDRTGRLEETRMERQEVIKKEEQP